MIRLIYVAGRYRATTFEGIAQNISAAREVGVAMAKMGWYPVIPHCNTAHMELNTPEHGDEFWLAGTLEMMTRCDAVVLVPGWESSEGTKGEVAKARELRLPVFELLDHVPLASEFEPVVTTTSNKYRAELYDEVWQLARDMGCGNVANALGELATLRARLQALESQTPIQAAVVAEMREDEYGELWPAWTLEGGTAELMADELLAELSPKNPVSEALRALLATSQGEA